MAGSLRLASAPRAPHRLRSLVALSGCALWLRSLVAGARAGT